jgi:pimeloyl-ACP methyl ester carboxylesterase
MRRLLLLPLLAITLIPSAHAGDADSSKGPVKAVPGTFIGIETPAGIGKIPVYLSADINVPQPGITRVLIVFHGKLRNADVYNESGLKAIKAAGAAGKGTLLITPQFLSQIDIDAFHLPPLVLRWAPEAWMGGDNALNAPLSSFDAIDGILNRLADRKTFPNLKIVVLAGHSGGGQVMQRYAVAGRGAQKLFALGIHVRYVVANPSSYVYFTPERPALDAKAEFTFGTPRKSCNGHYDLWKYGINSPPPYLAGADFAQLEQQYIHRDVVYLLGTNDVDPNHPALDKSCSGEDEGPYRFFRGKAYFKYMELRHPELASPAASQKLLFVPGVEHDGDKMFNSPCGLSAIFDAGSCPTRELNPKP